ncbi:toxin-antitoxin system antitoxin component, TIGR02293 family protein [Pseudomonas floridensis]|uniref:Toxin-antitoxin system antitoxin component, TIGR02293 family protein n=1 Tax=Pseudomonas floridensis TaxID=1958950 RepID=A0A1X0N3M4_9PSED|nr:antitoxin Xre-like helix-turn-helix domain-containing protein [Pseudomonas floridensis]ORC58112.1 toxin-antitoxin system antitoxin component, TIGR02293 family protein [Pseudomonas floridensis]
MFADINAAFISEAAAGFWLLAHQLDQRSEAERLANIQAGFAATWARAVKDAFRLGNPDLHVLLNLSASTLERRLHQQQPLDQVASERLDRVARVAIHALEVLETPERASLWMRTLQPLLGEQMPLRMCETDIGTRQVHRAIAALGYGGPA